MVGWINDHILILSGWAALAVVFLLPALESSIFLGFVLPGETAVVVEIESTRLNSSHLRTSRMPSSA